MAVTTDISFHGVDHSEALVSEIRRRADHLETFFDRINRVKVTVEKPNRSHNQGDIFDVHIKISVPGPDIVISHEAKPGKNHEDAYVIIRDAFAAAERRLKKHAEKMRGERTRKARKASKRQIIED